MYIIDPEANESTGKVQLTTSNRAINVDLTVLPPSSSARMGQLSRKTAESVIERSCGDIKLIMYVLSRHDCRRLTYIPFFNIRHNALVEMLARENRAYVQRTMTVYAKMSNGNVNIFIPRSFPGILKTTIANGKMQVFRRD